MLQVLDGLNKYYCSRCKTHQVLFQEVGGMAGAGNGAGRCWLRAGWCLGAGPAGCIPLPAAQQPGPRMPGRQVLA